MDISKLFIIVAVIVISIVLGIKIIIDILFVFVSIVREVLSKKFMSLHRRYG